MGQVGHGSATTTQAEGEGAGEWNADKHGGAERRVWRKTHIGLMRKPWNYAR